MEMEPWTSKMRSWGSKKSLLGSGVDFGAIFIDFWMIFGRLSGSISRLFGHHFRIEFWTSFRDGFWERFGSIWEAFGAHFGSFLDPKGRSDRKRRISKTNEKHCFYTKIKSWRVANRDIFSPGGNFFDVRKRCRYFYRCFAPKVTKSERKGLHLGSLLALKRGGKASPKIYRNLNHLLVIVRRSSRRPWELIFQDFEDIRRYNSKICEDVFEDMRTTYATKS